MPIRTMAKPMPTPVIVSEARNPLPKAETPYSAHGYTKDFAVGLTC